MRPNVISLPFKFCVRASSALQVIVLSALIGTPWWAAVAQAQTVTVITSLPYQISAPGSYVLAHDLVVATSATAISIMASEVTLDCSGYSISNDIRAQASRGITSAQDLAGITVQNCTINNFNGGITLGTRNERVRLSNNDVVGSGSWGILARGRGLEVLDNRVTGSRNITSNRAEGIILAGFDDVYSEDAVVSRNLIADILGEYEAIGISVYGAKSPLISDNSIMDVRINLATQPGDIRVAYLYLSPASDAIVRNNTMMARSGERDDSATYLWDGGYAAECTGNTAIGFKQISYSMCMEVTNNEILE